MSQAGGGKTGCVGKVFRGVLLLVALVLGALAWDVWQIRALRPPEDRTFEGFVRSGRQGVLMIDGDRLYSIAPHPKTVLPYPDPPVYEFNRSGELVNWTPGTREQKGMISETPVRPNGALASLEQVRAWLVAGQKGGKAGRP
jgi:hypothetical protein